MNESGHDELVGIAGVEAANRQIFELAGRLIDAEAQARVALLDLERNAGLDHLIEQAIDVLTKLRRCDGHASDYTVSRGRKKRAERLVKHDYSLATVPRKTASKSRASTVLREFCAALRMAFVQRARRCSESTSVTPSEVFIEPRAFT